MGKNRLIDYISGNEEEFHRLVRMYGEAAVKGAVMDFTPGRIPTTAMVETELKRIGCTPVQNGIMEDKDLLIILKQILADGDETLGMMSDVHQRIQIGYDETPQHFIFRLGRVVDTVATILDNIVSQQTKLRNVKEALGRLRGPQSETEEGGVDTATS